MFYPWLLAYPSHRTYQALLVFGRFSPSGSTPIFMLGVGSTREERVFSLFSVVPFELAPQSLSMTDEIGLTRLFLSLVLSGCCLVIRQAWLIQPAILGLALYTLVHQPFLYVAYIAGQLTEYPLGIWISVAPWPMRFLGVAGFSCLCLPSPFSW